MIGNLRTTDSPTDVAANDKFYFVALFAGVSNIQLFAKFEVIAQECSKERSIGLDLTMFLYCSCLNDYRLNKQGGGYYIVG